MTLTSKEQARLRVLNNLLAGQIALDQAADLMAVSSRHAQRMLTDYRAGTTQVSTASSMHGVNVRSMSTVRLAVSAIVDAHKRIGLESPVSVGVTETLRGLARQTGVGQKRAKPLDADALAAIRATAFTPRRSRGGSLESGDTALKRGCLDIGPSIRALRRGPARL